MEKRAGRGEHIGKPRDTRRRKKVPRQHQCAINREGAMDSQVEAAEGTILMHPGAKMNKEKKGAQGEEKR